MNAQISPPSRASAASAAEAAVEIGPLELPADAAAVHQGLPANSATSAASAMSDHDEVRFALDAADASAVHELARASGRSLDAVLGAAWAMVLARLGGQSRFLIAGDFDAAAFPADAAASATRHALHVDLCGEPSVNDLLAAFDATLGDARAGRAPLAEQGASAPRAGLRLGGAPSVAGPDDLDLVVAPDRNDGGGVAGTLRFSTRLFQRATAERWAGYLRNVLAALPSHAAGPLAGVPMIGADERRLIESFNDTGVSPASAAGGDLIHAMVEAQAARTPDAVAVTMGDESLRYAELDARAERLARRLRALGVAPDVPVALYMERSLAMVVGLLAVLKAGGAYVPLDPSHPVERTAAVLAGALPRAILTQASLRDALPHAAAAQARVVLIDTAARAATDATGDDDAGVETGLDADAASAAAFTTASAVEPHHLAYVIFTSGSTGAPKGVAMHHGALANLLRWQAAHPPVAAAQRTLQFAALGFDVAFQEIFATLTVGGTLVLIDEASRRDPQALAAVMRAQRVQRLYLPFIALQNIAEYMVAADEALPDLQDVMTAGEQLHASPAVRAFFQRLPGCRLHNQYGPTESHVVTALELPADPATWEALPSIGRPIDGCRIHVLDHLGRPAPLGVAGEIHIGGTGVARGYLHRADLTAERFVADPFSADPAARLYRTGDIGRWRADGEIDCLGRNDQQVKVRGFRVELGEIEGALLTHPDVREAAVLARRQGGTDARLVAYVVAQPASGADSLAARLREHLGSTLPPYMVPSAFVVLDALPRSPNGKIDRRALPEPAAERPEMAQPYEEGRTEAERRVCAAFARALGIDRAGRADNFFDLGGDSLRVLKVLAELQAASPRRLSTNLFFQDPTPQAIARAIDTDGTRGENLSATPAARERLDADAAAREPIAIVGMAGRFPGAADVEQFWANLSEGRESIRFFGDDELDAGVSAALRADPDYVRARGVIDGADQFDAAFFGINPNEATLMDPQQRVFLEICWECMERAGHAGDRRTGTVGIFAGMHNATYFQRHVTPRPDLVDAVGEFTVMLGNEKDYLATRVAHRLNLTGPAISLNTACSTSLVAMAQAFGALRSGQCDMALAGGVAITCPPNSGYLHQEGAMLSPDGHTRSFDARAGGTVFGDGAGVVLMKRLSDAQADGDTIYALVRGVGVNNDGATKASFTAPSIDGQAAVVSMALASAGVDARSISYVEAHGTATPMGDPVEVAALSRAYARHTADSGFCAIGSVKSNVGHLLMAAGAAGVIKTALALHEERLPATLHFEAANPSIDFDGTPFRVADRASPWPRAEGAPRRAGVSSFGVGGTNAHVILEEAPRARASDPVAGPRLLTLSARTPQALARMAERLADHLAADTDVNLGDVAHTLRVGRKAFAHRLALVADGAAEAVDLLRAAKSPYAITGAVAPRAHEPVLLFPGQGAQYAGMGRTLYVHDEVFRAALDEAFDAFEGELPFSLRERLFSDDAAALAPTAATQPATFALEYALARRVLALGLRPAAMIGHSVGEFAAAVIAGVMSLADAARLVARRGALMQALPAGRMLSVRLSAAELAPYLDGAGHGVSLAAENGPTACVAAGPAEGIEALQARLEADGVAARALQTSHAFHSAMMDAAVAPFEALVREVTLSAPRRTVISTLTGRVLTADEATDPAYWARHLRETVRFSPAVRTALAQFAQPLFIELGPRATLATLARQHAGRERTAPITALSVLADAPDAELVAFQLALARLWTLGLEADLDALDTRERKGRVRLPTYPFERRRHWVDIAAPDASVNASPNASPAASAATSSAVPPSTPPASVSDAAPAAPRSLPTHPIPELSMPVASSASATPAGRRPALHAKLRELFEDISGTSMADADGATPFIDQGLDSLVLTQAALQVKKHFRINVTFRQLMESCRSFDLLAEHLDQVLPPEPVAAIAAAPVAPVAPVASVAPALQPAPAAQPTGMAVMAAHTTHAAHAAHAAPGMPSAFAAFVAPATQAGVPAPADATMLQQLIGQQMHLMQQQLALLAGAPAGSAQPVAVPAAALVTPSAAQATAAQTVAALPAPVTATALAEAPASGGVSYDVKKAFGAIARIHTTPNREITARQQTRLDAFVRRYVERTAKSKAFTAEHRGQMADPRVVNGFRPATKEITYQLVVDRSKGSRVWDIDGNEYVDVLNGFGMNMFGWQPDFINEALHRQLDRGYEIGPQHPLAAEVTARICELTGFDRAALCNTGSEAVMAAMRIARTHTGRSTIVLFAGSYHGTFDEVLVRAGRGARGIPATPGVMSGVFGDVRVLDYGTPESLEFIRQNADELAAVLVEPVQSRRPDFQPREFLQEVRAITEKSGACLIFDEVITGFRAHPGGAQAMFGIRADLSTYGKVIGGGMPIGAVAGKREFMDALDGGAWNYGDDSIPTVGVTYFAGTFVRHPLTLAAAKASLDHMAAAGGALQAQLNLHTAAMADELSAFCREAGAPLEIRYFASLWRVSWLEDHPLQDLLFAMMRSRGVHILDNFPCFMTTAHTHEDIATIKSAFKESLAEMQQAGFLPGRGPAARGFDAANPPVPDARLGRDKDGQPAWFVPDPAAHGKYVKLQD